MQSGLASAYSHLCVFCATSLQVMRRLRTALYDLARKVPPERQDSARRYIEHLNATVRDAIKDTEDLPKTVLMLLSVLTKTFLKRHPIV